MSPFAQILAGAGIVAAMMALLWIVERRTRDAGVVDVGWATGLGILAVFFAATAEYGFLPRRILLACLAGTWAFRLAIYLFLNRVWGQPEDGRYQTLRSRWGNRAGLYFFVFFQVQALLDVLLAIPFLVVVHNAAPMFSPWEWGAIAVWFVAVLGESLADWQLARFRADPRHRGRTCRGGLWGYSRHPNYFFEWLHWWTYVLMAIGTGYWWATLLSPALMLFFLLRVTGIPATERQAVASRGDDYRDYQRTTSAFIPWFPRRGIR